MTELVKVADINKAHKNPIAELVQMACKFDSHIEIEGEGKNINAKSLMGIMAFGLKEGIEVKVTATRTFFSIRKCEMWAASPKPKQ